METNIKQLRCGECGEENHKIFQRENGEIITECIKCQSQTEMVFTKPKITLKNVSGNGTLAAY